MTVIGAGVSRRNLSTEYQGGERAGSAGPETAAAGEYHRPVDTRQHDDKQDHIVAVGAPEPVPDRRGRDQTPAASGVIDDGASEIEVIFDDEYVDMVSVRADGWDALMPGFAGVAAPRLRERNR